MSVPIRKLLSRKFNNSFVNLAGLLTCVLSFTFPPAGWQTVVFEEMTAAYYGLILKKISAGWAKLTVAGTVPDFPKEGA